MPPKKTNKQATAAAVPRRATRSPGSVDSPIQLSPSRKPTSPIYVSSPVSPTQTPAKAAAKKTPPKKASKTSSKAGTKRKMSQTTDGYVAKKKPTTMKEFVSCWFDELAAAEGTDRNTLTTASLMPFMSSLDIALEGSAFLVLVYKLQVEKDKMPTLFEITKHEFVTGMLEHKIKNDQELLVCLGKWLKELTPDPDSKAFSDFYKWCFQYIKAGAAVKSIVLEMAVEFIEMLLDPVRYSLQFSPEKLEGADEKAGIGKFPHRKAFCAFLRETKPVKGINKDQWESFLALNSTVPWSMESYDPLGSWPSLYDEYANWHKENYPSARLSQNLIAGKGSEKGSIMECDDEDAWQEGM